MKKTRYTEEQIACALKQGDAAIGDDALDERETPPSLPQQPFGAVAVLDVGGVDIDVQQKASAYHPGLQSRPGALAHFAWRL